MQNAAIGAQTISSATATAARVRCAEELWAVECLLRVDSLTDAVDTDLLRQLNQLLTNSYQFNAVAG